MIKPHGADALNPLLVTDAGERDRLLFEASELPSLLLSSAAAANAVMLGGGYFTPLTGYMNVQDAVSVAATMQTTDGLFWPVPVLNLTDDVSGIEGASRIALRDPNVEGNPILAVMDVDAIELFTDQQLQAMTEQVYGTLDSEHPGVAVFRSQGNYCVSGSIQVLNLSYFESEFAGTFQTAVEIRDDIAARGWEKVVAFQTRNPMHLAHEELCRMAMERLDADGIVIHMLLGKLKAGDIPASVRDACIRKMVDVYFPENTVLVSGYGFDMLYAGPREAVLHAVFRQNMGATHLIVGRDHAGVGDYYGPFDAQAGFRGHPRRCSGYRDLQRRSHGLVEETQQSRDDARSPRPRAERLRIPCRERRFGKCWATVLHRRRNFSRPEVAQILMDHYRAEAG